MLKPNPQCDGVWRLSLWEVTAEPSWMGLSALMKETPALLPLSPCRTQQGNKASVNLEVSSLQTLNGWYLNPGLPRLQSCDKSVFIIYTPPSLLYFASSDWALNHGIIKTPTYSSHSHYMFWYFLNENQPIKILMMNMKAMVVWRPKLDKGNHWNVSCRVLKAICDFWIYSSISHQ